MLLNLGCHGYLRGAAPLSSSSSSWHLGPVQFPTHLQTFQDVVLLTNWVVAFTQVPLLAHSPVSHGHSGTTFCRSTLT